MNPALYCTTDSCTDNCGNVRYGTQNCTTPPPTPPSTCTDPAAQNYGGPLPCTYTPTCTDPYATNYGQPGSCTYPPTLDADLSQSTNETRPGEQWTLTWDSTLATSCTVTYSGPTGSGTISSGPKQGSQNITLTMLGTYTYVNTCTDGSGTDTATRIHYIRAPDLVAGATTPTSAMVNTQVRIRATVTNQGQGNTRNSFYSFVQLASGTGGSGTVTDLTPADQLSSINGGNDRDLEVRHTFTALGTYSLRACADKSNSSDSGTIPETNGDGTAESNNCGPWTNITITDGSCPLPWGGTIANGQSVTAYNTSSVVAPDSCNSHDQTRTCTNGVLSGSYLYPSCGVAVPVSTFNVGPRTVEEGGLIKITWSIQNPNSQCKIVATVERPASCDSTCQSARDAAEDALNDELTTGRTNQNDPNGGNRLMTTALQTAVSGGFARGEKSVNLNYSTTFTLSCGSTGTPSRSIIYVTDKNEG